MPETGEHAEREDDPWAVEIPDHPRRSESAEYAASRRKMNELARTCPAFFGEPPYQDHHAGGLWLKDAQGWFVVLLPVGLEWSAQFCADPARVDLLRQYARRVYAAFPDAVAELGIRGLLDTPITDAEGVAHWTDSICNASVPLPADLHTGVVPHQARGGWHHYPKSIWDVQLTKRADFQLWVTTEDGHEAAVLPVAAPGEGDGRVTVAWAHPASALHAEHQARAAAGEAHILPAGHPLARQAFSRQVASDPPPR